MNADYFYSRLKATPFLDYLYWSLVTLCVADWALTMIGVFLGAQEMNPLFVFLGNMGIGIYASVSIGKIVQILIFTGLWRTARAQQNVIEWRLGFGMVLVLYCWVVTHNLSVILG